MVNVFAQQCLPGGVLIFCMRYALRFPARTVHPECAGSFRLGVLSLCGYSTVFHEGLGWVGWGGVVWGGVGWGGAGGVGWGGWGGVGPGVVCCGVSGRLWVFQAMRFKSLRILHWVPGGVAALAGAGAVVRSTAFTIRRLSWCSLLLGRCATCFALL